MNKSLLIGLIAGVGVTLCAPGGAGAAQAAMGFASVDDARLVAADAEPQNWLSHGRSYAEERFSRLDQIHAGNVAELRLAWYHDFDTQRGQEATPIVVDGLMFTSSAWSKVQAFDAASGRLLWQYDPEVPGPTGIKACCDVVNRGVAVWKGRVYVATLDGRLIALDARSGKPIWSQLTVDPAKPYTITGAPRIVKGKVLIGNAGGEYGVRGYVSAYDAETGRLAWRFYTVPGRPGVADGAASDAIHARVTQATWSGEWWKAGGGGTVWDSMAFDPALDLLYIGVGNGSPWNPDLRSPGGGDNLFLCSIVALRPDTGEYVWHYQETPGEQWDYTATQQMILADLSIGGQKRQVIMQAPKNGFFYVLDRRTGELLSAKPFAPVNWAKEVDVKTGRPLVHPEALYHKTGKPWLGMPGPLGAHSWHSMSFNPITGVVYIPVQELGFPYVADPHFKPSGLAVNLGIDLNAASLPQDEAVKAQVMQGIRGHLLAWDPVAQREVWRVQHAGAGNGGVLATAGNLVFQGNAAGKFAAYRANDGQELWSFAAQTGVVAAPVTYAVADRQYVTVLAGWGGVFPLMTGEVGLKSGKTRGRGRVLTFALGGSATLPGSDAVSITSTPPPARFGAGDVVEAGKARYHRFCIGCHGDAAVSGGVLPDLRHSPALGDARAWRTIVAEGALATRGMVAFGSELSASEIESIRAYVVARAHDERREVQ